MDHPGSMRRRRVSQLKERLRPTRGYRAARAAVIASRDRRRALTQVPRVVLRELRRPAPSARPASPVVPTAAAAAAAAPAADVLPDGVDLRLSTAVRALLPHDRLAVGLVGTAATARALGGVTHLTLLPPDLGPELVRRLRPDLVLVEAAAGDEPAWAGLGLGAPRRHAAFREVVAAAGEEGVPVVLVPAVAVDLGTEADHVLEGWRAGVDLRRSGPLGPRAAAEVVSSGSAGPAGERRAALLRGAGLVDAGDDESLALEAVAAGAPLVCSPSLGERLGLIGLPGVGVGAPPGPLDAAGVVQRLGWLVAHGHTADRAADRLAEVVGAPAGGRGLRVGVADDDTAAGALLVAASGADLVLAASAAGHADALVAAAWCTGAPELVAAPDAAEPFPVATDGPVLAWRGADLLAAGPGGVAGETRGVAGLR